MTRPRARCRVALGFVLCLGGLFSACASMQGVVPVDSVEPEASTGNDAYVIGVGDLLNVLVWDQDKMSARVRVRTDGRISLPLLNDVQAAGETPAALIHTLEESLTSVVVSPKVTIIVEESRPLSVSVLGEVSRPGLQTLDTGAGVAQALAASGGLSAFAHKDRIFVLRSGPRPARIWFKYEDITRMRGKARVFRLRSGDVVVVE